MMLPLLSRSTLCCIFGAPVFGSYTGIVFCAVPVLPPVLMPAAFSGANTPLAVPLGPPVTIPMIDRKRAAVAAGITWLKGCGGWLYSIFGFISLPSILAIR